MRAVLPEVGVAGRSSSRGKKLALVATVASIAALSASSAAILPYADAATRARNGLIVISVQQPPFTEVPNGDLSVIEDRDLFAISVADGGIQRIATGSPSDGNPRWSPDGRQIVFARSETYSAGAVPDLYVINADGTDERNLTNTPEYDENWPAWSPDGTQILFSSDRPNPDVPGRVVAELATEKDLYVMDADGSNLTRLTSDPGYEVHGVWSLDGKWIAFIHRESLLGQARLALMHPDGSNRRVLVEVGQPYGPTWSPDGSKIAFWDNGGDDLWMVNSNGRNPHPVTSGVYPSWSPDGRWIAFTSNRDGAWKLYKMRPDGSHVTTIIDIDLQTPFSTPDWGPRP